MWATLAAMVVAAGAGGATTSDARCASRHSVTLAENAVVRVYSRPSRFEPTDLVYAACLKATGRRSRLGERGCFPDSCDLGPFALTGSLVAVAAGVAGRGDSHFEVRLKDIRSGRMWQRLSAIAPPEPLPLQDRFTRIFGVRDLVVSATGGLAWIAGDPYPPVRWEVHRSDATGHAVLDAGLSISPRSLSLRGGTITWRNGADTRTAAMR
jgi:hypothetical protein